MIKVSIIVPVYNTEQYLKKCLDSLIGQTLEGIEIIVVNDGSPDNSQEIIEEYMAKYPEKVKGIVQENKGLSGARNSGIDIAKGEYIAFVDSDDYVEAKTYEKVYNHAKENDFDIVGFGYKEIRGEDVKEIVRQFKSIDTKYAYMLEQTMACNKLYKREIFEKNNLRFRQGIYYEDLEFIPRLSLYTKKIGWVDEYFYQYIMSDGSIMRQKKYNPKFQDIYFVLDILKENLENTEYKKELEYIFIEHLLHGAVLRFLDYEEGKEDIAKISKIMKKSFPHWRKNPYLKLLGIKYKIFCELAYWKQIKLLKLLLNK